MSQIRGPNNAELQSNYLFYAREILLTLQFLKRQGIIYRDLKPENIVLSMQDRGHIKLVDFGFAKMFTNKAECRTRTNCGTPAYIAPEILKDMPYSYEVDVWSFGVLIAEIVQGQSPFHAEDTKGIYEKIVKCQPTYNSQMTNQFQLRDLLGKIFVLDQDNRLKIEEIKDHSLFADTDWSQTMIDIFTKTSAPFIPAEEQFYQRS